MDGGLKMSIGRDDSGNVVLNFGKPIAWVAVPPADAAQFALTMLSHAGAAITVSIDDAMVARAREYLSSERDPKAPTYVLGLLQFALHGTYE